MDLGEFFLHNIVLKKQKSGLIQCYTPVLQDIWIVFKVFEQELSTLFTTTRLHMP